MPEKRAIGTQPMESFDMVRVFFDPLAIFRKPRRIAVPSPAEDRAQSAREQARARAEARRRARARRGSASTILTATGATTTGVITSRPTATGA